VFRYLFRAKILLSTGEFLIGSVVIPREGIRDLILSPRKPLAVVFYSSFEEVCLVLSGYLNSNSRFNWFFPEFA